MPRRALLVLSLGCAACGSGGTTGDDDAIDARDDGFDRRAMLQHLADAVIVPAHADFVTAADALTGALDTYCTALDGGAATTERDAARQAWRDAMLEWERVDAVLVGPAAMNDEALRYRIYAWPLAATCGVDREITERWADPGAYTVEDELANVRSLAAIEYLLFVDATGHTCAAPPTGWDALGADLPRARCGLAAAIAADVAAGGQLALDGWDGYTAELAGSGQAGENLVSDALFYVDKMVKDMKLGEAAGIVVNACGTVMEPCEREVEHRWADHATPALRVNLVTLREAFTGTTATADGPSFDDHLRALGAGDVADRMTGSIDAAIALADALPDSFLGALENQRDDVVALHTATKAFTDDLKSQFLTVLGLEIPDDVAGDND